MNIRMWRLIHPSTPNAIAKWIIATHHNLRASQPDLSDKVLAQMLLDRRYATSQAPVEFSDLGKVNRPDIECLLDACFALLNIEAKDGRTKKIQDLVTSAFKAIAASQDDSLNSCHCVVRLRAFLRILDEEVARLQLSDPLADVKRNLSNPSISGDLISSVDTLTKRYHEEKRASLRSTFEIFLSKAVYRIPQFQQDDTIRQYIRQILEGVTKSKEM